MTEIRGVRETSRDGFAQLALALHHVGTGDERIQDALALSELPADRRIELTALREGVLTVRHPELVP
jgi:hypothetical protein